jgi:serine/threonine-protein kinase
MFAMPVSEGEILAGRYRVERVLGIGGMGVVVAAIHVQLGQRVAVKFLKPETCQHPAVGVRFLREARAAARIQSEHVARVIDFGTLESGAPYMVMEHLSGADLSQLAGQRLPIEETVEYVLQACEGIADAHAMGVIHRDVKPANLFVTRRSDGSPLVKVLDFGISKATDEEAAQNTGVSMTVTGAVLGSPAYMSPEQVRSAKDIDGRVDVWALGSVLHELLAGKPVFHADTLSALLAMIAADPPARLRTLRPDVPIELEQIVLKCLCKDRDGRFADVGELAQALKPFGPARACVHADRARDVLRSSKAPLTNSSASDRASAHGDSMAASVISRWRASTRGQRRRRLLALAVAALLGGVVLVGVLFEASRKRKEAIAIRAIDALTGSGSVDTASASAPAEAPIAVTPVAAAVPSGSGAHELGAATQPPREAPARVTNEAPKQNQAQIQRRNSVAASSSTPLPASPPVVPAVPAVPAVDRGANPF